MSDQKFQIHAVHAYKVEVGEGVYDDDTTIIDVAETDTIATLLDRLAARRKWSRRYAAELRLFVEPVTDDAKGATK